MSEEGKIMRIQIESTTKIVKLVTERGDTLECRVWEGATESGVLVQCLIARIGAEKTQDLSQFEAELQECRPPSPDIQMFPLRLIL